MTDRDAQATPITDAAQFTGYYRGGDPQYVVKSEVARDIERELKEAKDEIARLRSQAR